MPHQPRGKYDPSKRRPGGEYHPTPEQEKRIEAAIAQADAELELRKQQKQVQTASPNTATPNQIESNMDPLEHK